MSSACAYRIMCLFYSNEPTYICLYTDQQCMANRKWTLCGLCVWWADQLWSSMVRQWLPCVVPSVYLILLPLLHMMKLPRPSPNNQIMEACIWRLSSVHRVCKLCTEVSSQTVCQPIFFLCTLLHNQCSRYKLLLLVTIRGEVLWRSSSIV